jgi:EAL domain-containing protein (putative c-di-GMP-specific phosphodiesterase class I)
MIALAHELGMTVVAKSIEFEGILQRLVTLSCDVGQGYLFSRPMAAAEFTEWSSTYFT